MYPWHVILTLVGMITAGAGRIVAVKAFYQFNDQIMQQQEKEESFEMNETMTTTMMPLFVTLLYLMGQSLSLVVYLVSSSVKTYLSSSSLKNSNNNSSSSDDLMVVVSGGGEVDHETVGKYLEEGEGGEEVVEQKTEILLPWWSSIGRGGGGDGVYAKLDQVKEDEEEEEEEDNRTTIIRCSSSNNSSIAAVATTRPPLDRMGSKTGLTNDSKRAVAWVHKIPWYAKPILPGLFNLCNSALRWGCLVFVAASTAEILISGLELILSVVAARWIRKRNVSNRRWTGVFIVAMGILVVGFVHVFVIDSHHHKNNSNNGEDQEQQQQQKEEELQRFLTGNILIVGQCIFSVLQDLSEEILMQETNFPATLLLGMEGFFGLMFGIPIYYYLFLFQGGGGGGEEIYQHHHHHYEILFPGRGNPSFTWFEMGLVVLVLLTGILNIRTTEVTSSMTRNVWKQFRILLVWIFGLGIYYFSHQQQHDDGSSSSSSSFGEPWENPASLYVAGGFAVILTGVYTYYSN